MHGVVYLLQPENFLSLNLTHCLLRRREGELEVSELQTSLRGG